MARNEIKTSWLIYLKLGLSYKTPDEDLHKLVVFDFLSFRGDEDINHYHNAIINDRSAKALPATTI